MSELFKIIIINLLILVFLVCIGYVHLKWKAKKRNDEILDRMENSYQKYAAKPNSNYLRKIAEYDKKHPFKAMKRKLKEKVKWLL